MLDSRGEVLVIGAGTAGLTHLRVLEGIPSLTVCGVVDPNAAAPVFFRNEALPLYRSIAEAGCMLEPGIVAVATPTPTHAQVCRAAIKQFPASAVLVEKPAADNWPDARSLLSGTRPVNVAFHMAFAPEVLWGYELTTSRTAELGAPVSIESWSADPYQRSAAERLANSWVDSGINELSVIERFAKVEERLSLRQIGDSSASTFAGTFRCAAHDTTLRAAVLTSWHVTDATRSTRVRYSTGAELVMDHHAVAGYLRQPGGAMEFFGSDGKVPRRDTHYQALYCWWLVDKQPIFPPETALRLHELLLAPDGGAK
jgi:predicted dehydrogenase